MIAMIIAMIATILPTPGKWLQIVTLPPLYPTSLCLRQKSLQQLLWMKMKNRSKPMAILTTRKG